MHLYLNAAARDHIIAAQRVMLAPLVYDDLEAWITDVNEHLKPIVGADHTVALVVDEQGVATFTNDTDRAPFEAIDASLQGYDDEGFAQTQEASLTQAHRARRAAGSGAYHEEELGDPRAMKQADLFRKTFAAAGIHYMMGLSTPLPQGEVTICTGFERPGKEGFGPEGVEKLRLVVPAFEAGVQAWRRLSGVQHLLDQIEDAAAVFEVEGRILFQNRALDRILRTDPDRKTLLRAMRAFARALQGAWNGNEEAPARGTVHTGAQSYRFAGSPLHPALFGTASAVLVHVTTWAGTLPPNEALQARHGLTPREAEVAGLLAKGLDNAAIADRLFISPHTARRHTEKVLHKLGVESRAAVALALLGTG